MYRIKICGMTNATDLRAAVAAGADAVGWNFCAHSSRYIQPSVAAELRSDIPQHVKSVGVFVNESVDRVRQIAELVSLDMVQLHGDELPGDVESLAPLVVYKAVRLGPGQVESIVEYVRSCADRRPIDGLLVDAYVPGQFGGTGQTVDWGLVQQLGQQLQQWLPVSRLVLAGGLDPTNVENGIRATNVGAVDVASGVESSPGRKDALAMQQFVAACRRGFSTPTAD